MKNISIEWKSGSINDNIIKHCKANNIQYEFDTYFRLCVLIDNVKYIVSDYKKINGDLFNIVLIEI